MHARHEHELQSIVILCSLRPIYGYAAPQGSARCGCGAGESNLALYKVLYLRLWSPTYTILIPYTDHDEYIFFRKVYASLPLERSACSPGLHGRYHSQLPTPRSVASLDSRLKGGRATRTAAHWDALCYQWPVCSRQRCSQRTLLDLDY